MKEGKERSLRFASKNHRLVIQPAYLGVVCRSVEWETAHPNGIFCRSVQIHLPDGPCAGCYTSVAKLGLTKNALLKKPNNAYVPR